MKWRLVETDPGFGMDGEVGGATESLRGVVDTSVLISAVLLPRSVPRLAFDSAQTVGRILGSEATIGELESVLRRPKFARYVRDFDRLEFR